LKVLEDDLDYEGGQAKDLMLMNSQGKISQDESSDGNFVLPIVLGVLFLLIFVGIVVGVIMHKRNVHPKVLVRPYVQRW